MLQQRNFSKSFLYYFFHLPNVFSLGHLILMSFLCCLASDVIHLHSLSCCLSPYEGVLYSLSRNSFPPPLCPFSPLPCRVLHIIQFLPLVPTDSHLLQQSWCQAGASPLAFGHEMTGRGLDMCARLAAEGLVCQCEFLAVASCLTCQE